MTKDSSADALAEALRRVAAGAAPGARLPSSRELVSEYAVSPLTVARAVARLAAEGLVMTRPGQGTFVVSSTSRASADSDTSWQTVALPARDVEPVPVDLPAVGGAEGTISLAGGYLHPSLQPTGALASALARAGRRPGAWDRSAPRGIEPLRKLFARQIGPPVTAQDVLITSGGQSALSLAFRAIALPGATVLVESPTYPGALAAIRGAGMQPRQVPMDEQGLRPDLLSEAFGDSGARVLYCQPAMHNPTGRSIASDRRAEILEVARAAGAFLVEDDFARHLAHGRTLPRPLITDDEHGSVIHVTSLTKPSSPSFRLGALAARGPVMRRLEAVRYVDDFFVARPLQEAAVELLSSPAWDRHLARLRVALLDRRRHVATGMATYLPGWMIDTIPDAGLHLWVRLPADFTDAAVADAARRHGVIVNAGSPFFAADPDRDRLRINIAAADRSQLTDAARRLAAAFAELE